MSKKTITGDVDLRNLHLKQLPVGLLNDVHVSGHFNCGINKLTSLVGSPNSVGGHFDCFNNKLTSLEGAPKTVGGDFSCVKNNLTSLSGAPSSVGGSFSCRNNAVKFTEEQVRAVCKVEGTVYV